MNKHHIQLVMSPNGMTLSLKVHIYTDSTHISELVIQEYVLNKASHSSDEGYFSAWLDASPSALERHAISTRELLKALPLDLSNVDGTIKVHITVL